MKTLAIVSGGLDSTVLTYLLSSQGHQLHLLSFDYGQRHFQELSRARDLAHRLSIPFTYVDLKGIKPLLSGSSLTDDAIEVPDGHYASEVMKSTVVQNRNAIMLSIAFGMAASREFGAVAIGVHSGDHFIYPDCRIDFLDAFARMEHFSLGEFARVQLLAPFNQKTKADIVSIGNSLGVPFSETWSCYKGHDKHCGTCGTCVERKEAFILANVPDPTVYES